MNQTGKCLPPVFALLVCSALAQSPDILTKPVQPVAIAKGDVYQYWGNSEQQISELVAQCGMPAIVDLGGGWTMPESDEIDAVPELLWPLFLAKSEQPMTAKVVFDQFIKDRPAYRYRSEGNILLVEPVDSGKSLRWLLESKYSVPVSSKVDKSKGWRLSAEAVIEASLKANPEWAQTKTEFHLGRPGRDFGDPDSIDAFPSREIAISNLKEFIKYWIQSGKNRSVVVKGTSKDTNSDRKASRKLFEVTLYEWPQQRFTSKSEDLLTALRGGGQSPKGQDPIEWRSTCSLELSRRYLLNPEVISTLVCSPGVIESMKDPREFARLLLSLDEPRFGPYITDLFWKSKKEIQDVLLRALIWLPVENRYKSFWEKLAKTVDPGFKETADAALMRFVK